MTLIALRALGLGDFLTGVPAYRALARAFPNDRRLLAAPRALHPLLDLLGGAFAGALDVSPFAPLPPAAGRPHVAVNLHGRGPQSHRVLLGAPPRRLLAYANADVAESAGGPVWREDEHEVVRWCRLLREFGIPADPGELALAVPSVSLAEHLRGVTVVHPGAASVARRWPAERWGHVVRALRARGERVVLTGTPGERELTHDVARRGGLDERDDLAGRTSLVELAALVACAARVLCADTGVAHLATAYGTPSLVLFGPVPPSAWGPPPRPLHRVLWAGRRGDPHAAATDPGLLAIEPADVFCELERLAPYYK